MTAIDPGKLARPKQIYPMRYAGGLFLICVGGGIMMGALIGKIGYGLMAGAGLGAAGLLLGIRWTRARWGRPSRAQRWVVRSAVGLELIAFWMLGVSHSWDHMTPAQIWETAFAIVALHFIIMRWSHGRWIMALGICVLVWLVLAVAIGLPLAVVAAGDGLLKLGFGATMAWPLLKALSAPGYPLESPPLPVSSAE